MRITLLALEAAFILTGLVGVWIIYWPGALLLTGVFGVLATERIGAKRDEAKLNAQIRRVGRQMFPSERAR